MSRFKFLGSKGEMVKPDVYVVDKAVNPNLHADVLADTEPIPSESIVVLVDGATQIAKLAVKESKWSKGLGLGTGTGAPLASPAFTGNPTAPTAAVGTNTTQVATTAFVLANAGKNKAQIAALTNQATFADLTAATTAVNAIIAPLKA